MGLFDDTDRRKANAGERLREVVESIEEGVRISIKPTQRDPLRYAIHAGGRYVCAMERTAIDAINIREGDTWTTDTADAILGASDLDRARRFALNSLSKRMASTSEMARKLARRGHEPPTIERTIEDLTQAGLLNDGELGASVARSMMARKPAGRRLIEAKLRQRGLDADTARAATDSATEGRDPLQDAIALARSKARSLRGVDRATAQRRLLGALARRGFEGDVCWEAIGRVLGRDWDAGPGEEDPA